MKDQTPQEQKGRVLVVGAAKAAGTALLEQLSSEGYQGAAAEQAEALRELAESLQPEAILLSTTAKRAPELMDAIRGIERLCGGPLSAEPYLAQMRAKVADVYGLDRGRG